MSFISQTLLLIQKGISVKAQLGNVKAQIPLYLHYQVLLTVSIFFPLFLKLDLSYYGQVAKKNEISQPNFQFTTLTLPLLNSKDLQMRYDERSLFPKFILEMEAKMKATHALGMRVSRGARARGDTLQARSRGSHEVPQANNKKMTSWKVLLTSKGKDL